MITTGLLNYNAWIFISDILFVVISRTLDSTMTATSEKSLIF